MGFKSRTWLFSILGVVAASAAAAGTVNVSFAKTSGLTDAGTTPWEERANLDRLAAHLQTLGKRHLPAEQILKVEVLDVDLAGTSRPSRRTGGDVRIVKGLADWPRISLRYTLEEGGKALLNGEEVVADMNYSRGFSGERGADPLHYEKQMLDGWFKARFVERRAAGD